MMLIPSKILIIRHGYNKISNLNLNHTQTSSAATNNIKQKQAISSPPKLQLRSYIKQQLETTIRSFAKKNQNMTLKLTFRTSRPLLAIYNRSFHLKCKVYKDN